MAEIQNKNFSELDKIISKEFGDMKDLSKEDTKIKDWFDTGVYSLNYTMSKNLLGGIPLGRVVAFQGTSGVGKSLLAATAMRDPKLDMIILIDTEGGGNSKELIDFAGVNPSKVRRFGSKTFTSYRIIKKTGKVEEIKDSDLPSTKLETDKYIYVEGLTSKIQRLINTFVFNKINSKVLIVLDSLANVQSVRGLSGTLDVGRRVQDINNFFRNFSVEFERSNISFVFTNKVYQVLDGSGRYVANGGEAAMYNPSITVDLRNSAENDDMSSKELEDEKASIRTAIGRTMKPIKAKMVKSRFGTEMRTIPFLLDMGHGPVRLSGLFNLCKDFGVIEKAGGAWYSLPGLFGENKFMKKNFIPMIAKKENEYILKLQDLLEKKEIEMKKMREKFQANDIEEVNDVDDDEDYNIEDEADMKKEMIRDLES
jgi:RecA/RadA recombinase